MQTIFAAFTHSIVPYRFVRIFSEFCEIFPKWSPWYESYKWMYPAHENEHSFIWMKNTRSLANRIDYFTKNFVWSYRLTCYIYSYLSMSTRTLPLTRMNATMLSRYESEKYSPFWQIFRHFASTYFQFFSNSENWILERWSSSIENAQNYPFSCFPAERGNKHLYSENSSLWKLGSLYQFKFKSSLFIQHLFRFFSYLIVKYMWFLRNLLLPNEQI